MTTAKTSKYLFVSNTRSKLINIFFYQPAESYYVRQLVRLTDEEINSVRRELANLLKAGILESEVRGNRLYYWANPNNSLFIYLLLIAHQNTSLGFDIQKNLTKIGSIKTIFCSFSYLINQSNPENDIDLIIIGDVSLKEIDNLVKKEEQRKSREINYMVMNKSEYKLRRSKRDPFIINFFLNYPFVLYGSPSALGKNNG